MSAHHLKINPEKTELLFLLVKGSPNHDLTTHNLTTTFNNSVLALTLTARNLGVTLDSQLSLTADITATTRSCRYMLHNIRRIRHRFCSRRWLFNASTTVTPSWQVYLLRPSDLCSSSRMQQLDWSSASRKSPTPLRSSAPSTGYRWLPASASKHWFLRTVLQTDRAASTSGIWSHRTPQHVHSARQQPTDL